MTSAVQICNMALGYLNHGVRIAALDEGSNEADQCSLYYDAARRTALRAAPWAFASRYATLADLGAPASPQWLRMYAYPVDAVMVRRILPAIPGTPPNRWEVASIASGARVIMCDVEDAIAHYTADVTSPPLFDPSFLSAFAWQLASEIAVVLTGSPQMKQLADQQFMRAVNAAMVSNGSENPSPPAIEAEWIRARSDAANPEA